MLDVAGAVRVGTDAGASCSATNSGAMRYNGGVMEFCDGSGTWKNIATNSGISSCPGGFTLAGGAAGTQSAMCIHTSIQASASFNSAAATCTGISDGSLGNAHLCTAEEWHSACKTYDLNGTGTHWVFSLYYSAGNYAMAVAGTSANCATFNATPQAFATSTGYRCCFGK